MKNVTIVFRSGTVSQYVADDVQVHPSVLIIYYKDKKKLFSFDVISTVEVEEIDDGDNEDGGGPA